MTARERLAALFDKGAAPEPVVCLHTWGSYPFAFLGKESRWERAQGESLAEVYEDFHRIFPHDWLHVCEATFRPPSEEDAGYRCREREGRYGAGGRACITLDPEADAPAYSAQDVLRRGAYDHVTCLRSSVGDEVMIFPNQEAPGSVFPGVGWERQMTLAVERPEEVERWARVNCRRFLEHVKAARMAGADGYIFSEGYGGAIDLLSPHQYERLFLDTKREFYAEVRRVGLRGIAYVLGNVMPYLELINRIRPDALMIEESKKGFVLDPVEVRKRLDPAIVLFGNLDSVLLLEGDPKRIEAELRRQARALRFGPFVFINGSPLCPGTPAANIEAFLRAAASVVP